MCSGCARKAQQLAGVCLDDFFDLVVGNVEERFGSRFARVGPVRVRVREITFHRDAVDAHGVAVPQSVFIVDETGPKMFAEQIRGSGVEVNRLVVAVTLLGKVGAF